ncbi:MAG: tRNA (guanosine(37)-N1)-methyltransferase TrmD [Burkholderiaceae bacterium]|nr:tRNA (guanosine(37)-N1)-methyltransferase TrmD [Burkholderiaceae bacterium]
MDFEVISVFPDLVNAVLPFGVAGRAHAEGRYRVRCWNPRDDAPGNYRRVDDRPYGGGPGMVMMAQPLMDCLGRIRAARAAEGAPSLPVAFLSPQGAPLTQARVKAVSESAGLILLCGRYEAVDQRFIDAFVDEEISVGDFVVSGGELPALLLIDAVARLLPGALNDDQSAAQDSFGAGLLDCPHYTRPEVVDGVPVPPVLLSGNHREIERWRRRQALLATLRKRPDLLDRARAAGLLSADEVRFVQENPPDTLY